jgi:hypothetical protein
MLRERIVTPQQKLKSRLEANAPHCGTILGPRRLPPPPFMRVRRIGGLTEINPSGLATNRSEVLLQQVAGRLAAKPFIIAVSSETLHTRARHNVDRRIAPVVNDARERFDVFLIGELRRDAARTGKVAVRGRERPCRVWRLRAGLCVDSDGGPDCREYLRLAPLPICSTF